MRKEKEGRVAFIHQSQQHGEERPQRRRVIDRGKAEDEREAWCSDDSLSCLLERRHHPNFGIEDLHEVLVSLVSIESWNKGERTIAALPCNKKRE